MVYIGNAFSLNMVDLSPEGLIFSVKEVDPGTFLLEKEVMSVVGHQDTAALFSKLLGMEVAFNRTTLSLNPGDQLLVGQYSGPRLPEGTTTLPDGASVKWILVTF